MARAQLVEGAVERDGGAGGQGLQHPLRHAVVQVGPEGDGAFGQRPLGTVEQGGRIRADLDPQPFARGAPAQPAVERKTVRRQRLEAAPAALASHVLAVRTDLPAGLRHAVLGISDPDHALAQGQRVFHTVCDPRAGVGPDDDAVHHHLDVVLAAAVDLRRLVQRIRDAVHADAGVAGGADFVPQRSVFAAHLDLQRRQDVHPRAGRLGHDLVHDFVDRLRADGNVAIRTVGLAQPSHQDPQVVVDLGHRADGRARRVAQVLLFDGDGRRQAVDMVDLGLLHLADELAGVGAQAFHVPPLAFGVDRVHGQRTLARSAGAAEHGHGVALDAGVDVLQVVLLGTLDDDLLGQHARTVGARTGAGLARAPPRLAASPRGQCRGQGAAGVRILPRRQFFGRADGHDAPAGVAALRTQVDDPVGRLDYVQVVFHDQHRIAGVDKVVQHFEQQLDIRKVQPGSRFVQQVQRPARAAFDQFAGQLDPLGLAAGQRRRRLAQLHVIQAHVVQRLQFVADLGDVLEQVQRLLDVHLQHLGDRAVLELDLQRLAVVAVAFAHRAGDPDVGQEIHFQPRRAVAFAGLATAASHVEAEPARLVAPPPRLGHLGEQVADVVEHLDVRAGIGPRRAADRRLVDRDQLVQMLQPFDRPVRAGMALASVQVPAQGLDQDVVDQGTLARAGHAGHADEHAQGDFDVDVLQVVVRRAEHAQPGLAGRPAVRRDFDLQAARQVLAGDAAFRFQDFFVTACNDDFPAPHAGTGTKVDDVVGGPHRVLVVFDDQHRVAHVAQPLQRRQQAAVVPRVQADRGLVQDVQHADQAAADLAGQPDPLRFAAGQRRCGAAQREIVQAHVEQEAQPAADLLQHLGGDQRASVVQFQLAEEVRGVADRQVAHFGQRQPGPVLEPGVRRRHLDRPRLRVQPLAAARAAGRGAHVLFHLPQVQAVLGVAVAGQQVGDDALELAAIHDRRRAAAPSVRDVLVASAPQQQVLQLGIQVFPRRFQHGACGQAELALHRVGHALKDVPPPAAQVGPGAQEFEAAFLEGTAPVRFRNQQVGIKGKPFAQPVAFQAHALGTVEAEQLRAGRLETQAAVPAGVRGGENDVLVRVPFRRRRCQGRFLALLAPRQPPGRAVPGTASPRLPFSPSPPLPFSPSLFPTGLHRHNQVAFAEFQRQVHRLGQSRPDRRLDDQAVHHDLDVVPHLAVQLQIVRQGHHVAVHAGADEALFQQVAEQVPVFAFLAANQGRQDDQFRPFRQLQNPGDDLLAALRRDRLAAFRAESLAHAGEQHAQVVVDLRDRADRGPRVVAAGLLRDGDGGAEAADIVHVRLGHLAQELAGKAGQALDVPPLAFRVQRIERQGTFAGAADAGQANQLVPRQDQIDVPQVVLASALDDDIGGGHEILGNAE